MCLIHCRLSISDSTMSIKKQRQACTRWSLRLHYGCLFISETDVVSCCSGLRGICPPKSPVRDARDLYQFECGLPYLWRVLDIPTIVHSSSCLRGSVHKSNRSASLNSLSSLSPSARASTRLQLILCSTSGAVKHDRILDGLDTVCNPNTASQTETSGLSDLQFDMQGGVDREEAEHPSLQPQPLGISAAGEVAGMLT
jgi:hypothetical protein